MMIDQRLPQEHQMDSKTESFAPEANKISNRIVKRSILIFPAFSKRTKQIVTKIRHHYDPLWDKVAPHVTLVFPFDSTIETKKIRSVLSDVLHGMNPFRVLLSGFECFDSGHIFLNIADSNGILLSLIQKFYDHPFLSPYKPPFFDVLKPHITVAYFQDLSMMNKVYEKIKDRKISEEIEIDYVDVEIIGENDESIIEYRYQLE
jgi:2'-5' RNA ligase